MPVLGPFGREGASDEGHRGSLAVGGECAKDSIPRRANCYGPRTVRYCVCVTPVTMGVFIRLSHKVESFKFSSLSSLRFLSSSSLFCTVFALVAVDIFVYQSKYIHCHSGIR